MIPQEGPTNICIDLYFLKKMERTGDCFYQKKNHTPPPSRFELHLIEENSRGGEIGRKGGRVVNRYKPPPRLLPLSLQCTGACFKQSVVFLETGLLLGDVLEESLFPEIKNSFEYHPQYTTPVGLWLPNVLLKY